MKYALVLFAALAASPALSQSTEEPALADVINMPQVAAAPPLGPGVSTRLPEDVYYVITSQKPFVVIFSPDNGWLSVSTEPSPLQLRGRFVEDPTKKVTRNFTDKYIVVIEAAKTGSCELLVIPGTVTKPSDVIRRLIDAEIGPRPPPIPPPVPPGPVPPGPTPTPSPVPIPGMSVLVVFESATLSKLPPAQMAALGSQNIRDYLKSKAVDFRFYDTDVNTAGEVPKWKDAMLRPRKSLPWLIVGNGVTGYEGPFPADSSAVMALLKTYFGG